MQEWTRSPAWHRLLAHFRPILPAQQDWNVVHNWHQLVFTITHLVHQFHHFPYRDANCGATTLVWTITDTVDGCFSTDTMIIVNRAASARFSRPG